MNNSKHIHSVGVLKEVKDQENRVGLTTDGVRALVAQGTKVYIEQDAGVGAFYSNASYIRAGADILDSAIEVVEGSDIVVKVKEPVAEEFYWLEAMKGKTLFTFLHLASNPVLAEQLLWNNVTGVSYDTIEDEDGKLPLLKPMSQIAGKFAVDFYRDQFADKSLKTVLVVGGGVTGEAAVRRACDLGCHDVVVYERNISRAVQLEALFRHDPVDVFICSKKLKKLVSKADLLIGAVLVKGSKCPEVVTEAMIDGMRPGSFITDVSIDQGGCIFGSRPTSHSKPVFLFKEKVYCCIPNMPGHVPEEATNALTELTLPYLLEMASRGTFQYLVQEPRLLKGLNTHAGKLTNKTVAQDLGMLDRFVEI